MTYETSALSFPVHPPFRLDLTVWALRRRKTNIVDLWDGSRYSRILVFDNEPVKVTAIQKEMHTQPGICLTLQSEREVTPQLQHDARLTLQKMLGLTVDLQPFYAMAGSNDILSSLVQRFRGVRPPRFPTIFEALINAVACQQVTLDLGIVMLGRLSEGFGKEFVDNDTVMHAFPRPEDFQEASEDDIRELGFSRQKARAMKELADGILDKRIDLTSFERMSDRDAVAHLTNLRGIGRWSAEYVLLRGLGRLDSFPGDDVGAQSNLERIFRLGHKPGYEEIRTLTSQWHPYEGLVYFHLLLEKLHQKGVI
ncbi:MAG TPA: DNA-3-methyladenine glycosylase 2 family protein [Deltaproteobacteria bacterium]|nr:DNA-3-methyladenine glycosylase 2 family protein [Deltaproteobacteria bacterium]